jgi:hypothetical protein
MGDRRCQLIGNASAQKFPERGVFDNEALKAGLCIRRSMIAMAADHTALRVEEQDLSGLRPFLKSKKEIPDEN